jgi:hypothetical protein
MVKKLLLVLSLLIAFCALTVQAGQYASLGGKFKISYPDDWTLLDYNYVDSVLFDGRPGKYEAVFAPSGAQDFTASGWVVLTVDLFGTSTQHIIDSSLDIWKRALKLDVRKYSPEESFTAVWKSKEIAYWPKDSLAALCNDPDVTLNEHVRNQLVVKFFERGSANFYFYGPDSLWDAMQPKVQLIVGSFTTINYESALPHDEITIVDSAQFTSRTTPASSESTGKRGFSFAIYGGSAVAIIIIALAARRHRGRKYGQRSNS